MRQKISKKYLYLCRCNGSELFTFNRNLEFTFKIGRFKGLTVDYLYAENQERFIDWLEDMWYQVGIIDKHNINTIISELIKNNNSDYDEL